VLEPGVGRGVLRRTDPDGERVASLPGEMPLDESPRRNGLRTVRLRATAGQSMLDARRNRAQRNDECGPSEEDGPAVLGRPAAKASEYAESEVGGLW
jgi:hypothetical protein